jgi:hypothetical protein
MSDFQPVANRAEVLFLELGDLTQTGPRFRIIHRFRKPGTDCAPGEEIAAVYFIHRRREILVPLSPALLLLFEYFARNRRIPQHATQIAAGVSVEPFFQDHGLNSGVISRRKISRSSVKGYVEQTRRALTRAFGKAPLSLDPKRVLVSKETVGKEVLYHLRATVEWQHIEELREIDP